MKSILQLFFIILFCYPIFLCGQQLPIFTQYRNQLAVLNPASLSIDYIREDLNTTIGITHRQQWLGIKEHPVNYFASARWLPHNTNNSWGGYFISDKIGAISNIYFSINYAYLLKLKSHIFSLGLSGGYGQYKVDFNEILSYTRTGIVNRASDRNFDAGVGLFYTYKRKYYIGLAVPRIFEKDNNFEKDNKELQLKGKRHYFLRIGGYFKTKIGEATFIEPSIWIRSTDESIGLKGKSVDLNIRFKPHDAFWLGVSGGTSNIFHIEAGGIIGQDRLMKIGGGYRFAGRKILGKTFELNVTYSLDM